MSLDTIPTRSNLQTIDQTWFNIIQTVLSGNLVPRNTSGVPTTLAGYLGSASYAWTQACAQQLALLDSVSGNLVTLNPPTGLAAGYSLTMPAALPAAVSKLVVDTSGNLQYGAASVAVSNSSGGFNTQSSGFTNVLDAGSAGLSATIVTSGRPVLVGLKGDGTSNNAQLSVSGTPSSSSVTGNILILRGASTHIVQQQIAAIVSGSPTSIGATIPTTAVWGIDAVGAGTQVYTVLVQLPNSASNQTFTVSNSVLFAMEL